MVKYSVVGPIVYYVQSTELYDAVGRHFVEMAPSSSGLGHEVFSLVTRVRIPMGSPRCARCKHIEIYMDWFVYIVECKDRSLYTGITNDVSRRIWKHNNKKGAISVRGKLPVKLVYKEFCEDKILAAKRESEIKGWNRKKKLDLIKSNTKGLP